MTANIAIGAPLHFEGTTIIPVVGMSVDFGGGGGSGLEKGMVKVSPAKKLPAVQEVVQDADLL